MSASSQFFLQKGLPQLLFNGFCTGLRLKPILFAEWSAKHVDEMITVDGRLKPILFAERSANAGESSTLIIFPPQANSFCRKVCGGKLLPVCGMLPASSQFFLLKGLHDIEDVGEVTFTRLKPILFAERSALGL